MRARAVPAWGVRGRKPHGLKLLMELMYQSIRRRRRRVPSRLGRSGIRLVLAGCRAVNTRPSREGDMKVETDVKAGGAIWGDGRGNHNETIVG